jgi:lipid-binding SYLF domain-containing protein
MSNRLIAAVAIAVCAATGAFAADREAKAIDRIDMSADVITQLMRADDKGIPQSLIDRAKCVVVIPGMKKAGFIVGGAFGRGYAVCRHESGRGWSAPAAMAMEGGSVGFQIGASEQDVVLLVMNDGGIKHLLSDKFTLGGDATVSAGPVGRDASAQTDALLNAEMLSYSRSRGLFAGISLTGATLHPDHDTNRELYGRNISTREILRGNVPAPRDAHKLDMALNRDSHIRTN